MSSWTDKPDHRRKSYSGNVESSAEGIYSSSLTNVRFLVEDWVL